MEYEIVQEQAKFLPNPDIVREPIVSACEGCNKVYDKFQDFEGNFVVHDSFVRYVCIAYVSPKQKWKLGCALASNKKIQEEERKKLNPIKASKRRK